MLGSAVRFMKLYDAISDRCLGIEAPSRDDFQRRDLVAFQFEEESKIYRAAGKVSSKPAGDDSLSFLFLIYFSL
jgi:hypothetical protein